MTIIDVDAFRDVTRVVLRVVALVLVTLVMAIFTRRFLVLTFLVARFLVTYRTLVFDFHMSA